MIIICWVYGLNWGHRGHLLINGTYFLVDVSLTKHVKTLDHVMP